MGGGLSLRADADSPSELGAKSILSDTIDGVTAAELVVGIEKYIRAGKTAQGMEAQFDVIDKDGGVLVSQRFEVPSILGGGSTCIHTWYNFDSEKHQVETRLYMSQIGFERGDLASTGWIKVHDSPVKVEFWVDAHEVRSSGLLLKVRMDGIVSGMGASASTSINEASISNPSELSVLSEPIEDTTVTPESFIEFLKSFLVDTRGATEFPDGSIMEELGASWGLSCYVRSVLNKEEGHMYTSEFGEDETLQVLRGTTHCQVHRDPFRLEMWHMQRPGRMAGETELKVIEPLLQGVLKDMQAQG